MSAVPHENVFAVTTVRVTYTIPAKALYKPRKIGKIIKVTDRTAQ